ncbi:M23 family metallopeptidase [Tropicimonas sp. TH_r6]|uniref:M23 family metallopeptidase n=1 Tax=Tropicimonas sp. TH_r6 TaxID=3082085 RepID=UPI0029536480|nr:M23 family metallopeptidase [Tropicimonas sp. TH_r6]MDV7143233.1 M23 family metallopeptidase [Tropicimonas sp. TH_r6]
MKPVLKHERGRFAAPFFLPCLLVLSTASVLHAEMPELLLPVDCSATRCFVQKHVDNDPGPGLRDFACGRLTSDGHKGTDIAVPPVDATGAGVRVVAAAAGRVRGLRDGMSDVDVMAPGAPNVAGRECGNGVVIDHGDGWESQYCHLKRGSLVVRKGEIVSAGTPLGEVGLSGDTNFYHLHFSLRENGRVVDPFRSNPDESCGSGTGKSPWPSLPDYAPGGVVQVGIANRVPSWSEVKAGFARETLPGGPLDALVVWSQLYAGEAGDRLVLGIDFPDGRSRSGEIRLEKSQPQLFRAWGIKAPAQGFKSGDYRGRVELWRGETLLARDAIAFRRP